MSTNLELEKSTENTLEPKVIGIGGIFFMTENPENTKEWYAKHLGFSVNEWGASFEVRNANNPEEINYSQWSPFEKNSVYFKPSFKEFMVNYRVQNLELLIEQLKGNGVQILDDLETFEYGKFIHIMDLDGNKIELWEPIDSVFTAMGVETIK